MEGEERKNATYLRTAVERRWWGCNMTHSKEKPGRSGRKGNARSRQPLQPGGGRPISEAIGTSVQAYKKWRGGKGKTHAKGGER